MKKRSYKMPLSVIVLYVVSIVFLMIGAFQIFQSYDYINRLVSEQGLVISENLASVFTYYITNSAAYFAYAIIIYAIGTCIDKVHQSNVNLEVEEIEEDDDCECGCHEVDGVEAKYCMKGRRKKSLIGNRHISR